MWRLPVLLLTAFAAVAAPGPGARPVGLNCALKAPPVNAGEEPVHGIAALVYPRARDMGPSYSGCQALFAPREMGGALIALTVIVRGEPQRLWVAPEGGAGAQVCQYRAGALVKGDAEQCPPATLLPRKSMPAGCTAKLRAQGGQGAWPAGCEYD